MVELIYEKNIKTKEVKRPARRVVRQDGKPETDKFFELPKGMPGAYRDTRVLAERYITETLKLAAPETRVDRYTWTSKQIEKAVTAITAAANVVKDQSKKVGDMLKEARSGSQPALSFARSTPTNKK